MILEVDVGDGIESKKGLKVDDSVNVNQGTTFGALI